MEPTFHAWCMERIKLPTTIGMAICLKMFWQHAYLTSSSFVLAGWKGFANDAKVLKDAMNRTNRLPLPNSNLFSCLLDLCAIKFHVDFLV